MANKKYDVAIILRLNKPLHDKLIALAAQEKRSLNSQIIYLLEKSLK